MKVHLIYLPENSPYPNSSLPVLIYENALEEIFLKETYSSMDVFELFQKNGYSNGWVNGIFSQHHYHSTAHEVLACFVGESLVQFGGPGGDLIKFRKGNVVLIPAGVSHKRIKQTQDFKIVGAYPGGANYDLQYGETENYTQMKENIKHVPLPLTDPVTGSPGYVGKYWL